VPELLLIVLIDSDGSICIPCAGTLTDCSNGTTSILPCDDNNPNTTNDVQTVLDCDGSICVPCIGIPVDCSNGTTSVVPCDDSNPCTINDEQTVLDSDGSICIPCAGTPTDCSTGTTSVLPCDDNDPNTVNDEQTVLDCDGSICIPCAGTLCNLQSNIQDPIASLDCQSIDNGVILEGLGSSTGTTISYEWIFNNTVIGTEITQEVFEEGIYTLRVIDNLTNCEESSNFEFTFPSVEFDPVFIINHEICSGQSDGSILIDTVTGGQAPYLFALDNNTFTTSKTFNRCISSDQITISVNKIRRIFIPNTFSPNNDGINDQFMIYAGSAVKVIHNFKIYNRWGATLFAANNFLPNDTQVSWDGNFRGKAVDPGVYLYSLEVEFADGRRQMISGDITLTK